MAEVLGLVASGLSVARITGSIVTTSFKIKALLDEVKDAPETLRDMLGHIELLAPILCEAATGGDDGAGTTNLPQLPATSHLQQALQKTLATYQAADDQLEILAGSLMSQINTARGGVRLKRAVVKVVLKKGLLAQYETRLQKTIQLLTLAQNTYIIALQRTQPEVIVSQLLGALMRSPEYENSPSKIPFDRSLPWAHRAHAATRLRTSTRQTGSTLHEYWQLGFAKMTGLVRIQTPSRGKDHETVNSVQDRILRIQVQMPTWLCASVFDAVFSWSYAGWTCSLNMYGYLMRGSVEFRLVMNAIDDDDVNTIHRLFQERRCRPLDWLVWDNGGRDESLLEYALRAGAWQASGYLLNYDTAQPGHTFLGWGVGIREESETHLKALITHKEISDTMQMICLPSLSKDLNSFTDLIGRTWCYNEFYTTAFEDQRLELAIEFVTRHDTKLQAHYPVIFQYLCESCSLANEGSTSKVLSCITWGLGNIVWKDQDVASKWYSAIRDTALRLDKGFVMPDQQLLRNYLFWFPSIQLFSTPTPFTNMFLVSMMPTPGFIGNAKCTRRHKIVSRLANCERAVQMWLNILQESGIDLLEYGRQESRRLKKQDHGWEFRIWRDVWHENPYPINPNAAFEVRLIGFEYGRQPEDWKLWWSEPTDGLVGDFWKEMEPEPLCIPGSWDEDF